MYFALSVLRCRYDYVEIKNDTNHPFGHYCGERTGHTVLVIGQYAELKFRSDINYVYRGFHLVFTAVPLGEYKIVI